MEKYLVKIFCMALILVSLMLITQSGFASRDPAGTPQPPIQDSVLNEDCTASIFNRTVRVNPDGSFAIPNIPATGVFGRVCIVCQRNGELLGGQSEFMLFEPGETARIGTILLGPIPPSVGSLTVIGGGVIGGPGAVDQLVVQANLSDGSMQDVTQANQGTTYTSSNSAIASVNVNGLVTAGDQSGTANISIINDGVFASRGVTVIANNDSDGDGLPNDFELTNGLNPNDSSDADQDPDGDGLSNLEEFNAGTDLLLADTDGDGLNDGNEIAQGTNPTSPDTDLDGLTDGDEILLGSNPLSADSDGDGLPDGVEVALVGNPFSANPFADNDGDGLSNLDEIGFFTDPNNPDTDGDGLTDGQEALDPDEDPLIPETTPPTVVITFPIDGDTLTEGATVIVGVDAQDNAGIDRVDFRINDFSEFIDTTPPFEFPLLVPTGLTGLSIGAEVFDLAGNAAEAVPVAVNIIPDPLTTVTGRVLDENLNTLEGANISVVELPGLSGTDGTFAIFDVPTVLGDIVVNAIFIILPDGTELRGTSVPIAPVLGNITDVGDIIVTSAQFEEDLGIFSPLFDDSSRLIPLSFNFPFYGQNYDGVYINNNGNMTFGSRDSDFTESVFEFLRDQPRIAPFWDDLINNNGDNTTGVYFNDQIPDRLVVTWFEMLQFFQVPGPNTVQAILFSDGRIQFGYRGIGALDSLVGLSPGANLSDSPARDYSVLSTFSTNSGEAVYEQFTGSLPFDLDNGFIIFTPNAGNGYDVRTIVPADPIVNSGTVSGTVYDENGNPMQDIVEVQIYSSYEPDFHAAANTDGVGMYVFPDVPCGGQIMLKATRYGEVVGQGSGKLHVGAGEAIIDVHPVPVAPHKEEINP